MRRAIVTASLGVLAIAVLAQALQALTGVGGHAVNQIFDKDVYTGVEVAGCAVCLARAIKVRRERVAWLFMSAALLLWTAGDLVWTVWLDNVAHPPFPSVADAVYFASYAATYVALVLLLRARLRPFRVSLWLDGLIAGLGGGAVAAALVFEPISHATHGSASTVAFTLAYPVLDILLLAVVLVAFALTGWRPGRSWLLIGAAQLVDIIADSIFSYQSSADTYQVGTLLDSLWPLAFTLLAAAAWSRTSVRRVDDHRSRSALMPSFFAVVALGLLGYAEFAHIGRLAAALAVAAVLVAMVRVALLWRENMGLLNSLHGEARIDGLTGLPNRRALMGDLADASANATGGEPRQLAFFDLDGFKAYNDLFGHPAGDALLARLAGRLEAVVGDAGAAYRLGGDEFCVLLHGRRADTIEAATAALFERGLEFEIGASSGVVTLPDDTTDAIQALQLADSRMYAAKRTGRTSSRRQARDVLLAVLSEREPELDGHVGGVAIYCIATGRQLGMEGEELDVLARAAELHDIGKVAMPHEILHKPAKLNDEEWRLIRQHTIIGERIVAAAPALAPVARLVRASHERWDGDGYPDGVRGEEIPLGARIITVCDAYDAMTTNRPYRSAMASDKAVEELWRCSGAQFDPEVVQAFVAAGIGAKARVHTAAPPVTPPVTQTV